MQQTFVVLHEGITKPRMKAQQIKNAKRDASKAVAGAGVGAGADDGTKFRSGFGSGSKPTKGMDGGKGKGK